MDVVKEFKGMSLTLFPLVKVKGSNGKLKRLITRNCGVFTPEIYRIKESETKTYLWPICLNILTGQ